MTAPGLDVYCLRADRWSSADDPSLDLGAFCRDALATERRIRKGVNLERERARYILLCRRIQTAAVRLAEQDGCERVRLGSDYIALLRSLSSASPSKAAASRLSACFFTPNGEGGVGSHLEAFRSHLKAAGLEEHVAANRRLELLQRAADSGAGVVEVLSWGRAGERREDVMMEAACAPTAPRAKADDGLAFDPRGSAAELLAARLQAAARSGGAVNFSGLPNDAVTEALHAVVYQSQADPGKGAVRVVYADGSEAAPFPLCGLTPAGSETRKENGAIVIRASLVSMRHPEMDERVDFCWFRNRKVSAARPAAEMDAACADETAVLLAGLAIREVELHIYQTGLEPAVVGFYRGLVRHLRNRCSRNAALGFRVIPFYYRGGSYCSGSVWS